jgi:SulP family sulfate permease
MASLPAGMLWSFVFIGLQLAMMCYFDTLLTATILDYKTDENTNTRRELFSQGAATFLTGLCGLAPGAQATDRSGLLLQERAQTRLAAVFAGVFVLLFTFFLPQLLSAIPLAVLSGILLKVAINIFDWKPLRIYSAELLDGWPSLRKWFREHAEDPVFIAHHEVVIILGTTILGTLWNMNYAVILFTLVYYGLRKAGMRMLDLKVEYETKAFANKSPDSSKRIPPSTM